MVPGGLETRSFKTLRISRDAAASVLFALGIYSGSLFADILLAQFSAPFLEITQILFLKRKPTFESLILYHWSLIDCADGKFCCKHTHLIPAQCHVLLLPDFHLLNTKSDLQKGGEHLKGQCKTNLKAKVSLSLF